MADIGLPTLCLANGVVAVAALISALTGFGYALLATPLLILLLPPQVVVPIVLISWLLLAVLLGYEARSEMVWGRIGRWLLGAFPGLFVGAYALWVVEADDMRSAIGAITLLGALATWWKSARPWQHEWPLAVVAGFFSGIMAGASGMSGPPVVLFGLNQNWGHRQLRATLIGYFIILHLGAILVLQKYGMVDVSTFELGARLLPGVFLGYILGMRWRERVDQRLFRYIVLGLLCAMGITVLAQ